MFAEVNGIRMFYEKRGAGRPLVMVHGNGEDHTIFDRAIDVLEKSYCCYAVDSRCHGQSGEGPLHYEDMAEDMLAFLAALDLRDVIFYGFSDGGIIGILAASRTDRITTLVTSGANLTPKGVQLPVRLLIRAMYLKDRDPKYALMLREPNIGDDVLSKIRANTLVLAGSRDLVLKKETEHIAQAIPNAELQILKGEGHGSYIVHSEKIAKILREYCRIR